MTHTLALCSTRTGAGRPLDRTKDDAILAAARAAFFERGFAAATIEDIAARAGVSKVTLYKRFGDKETLFETIVRNESSRMTAAFDDESIDEKDFPARLNAFGRSLISFLFHPDRIALERVLSLEFIASPGMGRRFFEAGAAACRGSVMQVLIDASAAGVLAFDDARLAAEDLISLWKGYIDLEQRYGVAPALDATAIAARVERGTRTFLRAYSLRPGREGEGV